LIGEVAEELGIDKGIDFGPPLAVLLLPIHAILFQADAGGAVLGATELGELLGDAEDGLALFGGVGAVEGLGKEAVKGDQDGDGGAVGQSDRPGAGIEIIGLFDELGDPGTGLIVPQPILEAALAPVAEILFGDGTSAEIGSETFLGVGKSIEPVDKAGAGFAIGEAMVQLFADVSGETGDFSEAAHEEVDG